MKLVFDTSILVEVERRNTKIIDKLATLREKYQESVAITSTVFSEFYYGYLRKKKDKEKALTELSKYELLHTTKGSSIKFAELKNSLEKKGKKLPIFDILIASIVMDSGGTIVTMDKHFAEIKELNMILLKVSSD